MTHPCVIPRILSRYASKSAKRFDLFAGLRNINKVLESDYFPEA